MEEQQILRKSHFLNPALHAASDPVCVCGGSPQPAAAAFMAGRRGLCRSMLLVPETAVAYTGEEIIRIARDEKGVNDDLHRKQLHGSVL